MNGHLEFSRSGSDPRKVEINATNPAVYWPAKTKERVVAILNDIISQKPVHADKDLNELMEHADSVLAQIPRMNRIAADASDTDVITAYRNLYPKLMHPKEWSPENKSDEEVAGILEKRFGMKDDN